MYQSLSISLSVLSLYLSCLLSLHNINTHKGLSAKWFWLREVGVQANIDYLLCQEEEKREGEGEGDGERREERGEGEGEGERRYQDLDRKESKRPNRALVLGGNTY